MRMNALLYMNPGVADVRSQFSVHRPDRSSENFSLSLPGAWRGNTSIGTLTTGNVEHVAAEILSVFYFFKRCRFPLICFGTRSSQPRACAASGELRNCGRIQGVKQLATFPLFIRTHKVAFASIVQLLEVDTFVGTYSSFEW